MEKYVSVIIPTYNRSKMLLKAIESVLNQTYQYFEIIVVDDGSTDNTEKIVSQVKDLRIKYIKLTENMGASYARNIGIKYSKYDYIAFEDSDDIWHKEKLEKQINKIEKTPDMGLVYCAFSYAVNGRQVKIPADRYKTYELEGNIFESLWNANKIGTPTILVKKECINLVGGFSEKLKSLEDYEFVLRVAEKYRIGYIDEILVSATYSTSGVNSRSTEQVGAYISMMRRYRNYGVKITDKIKVTFEKMAQSKKHTFERWRDEMVPDIISTNVEFDALYQIAQSSWRYKTVSMLMNKFICVRGGG